MFLKSGLTCFEPLARRVAIRIQGAPGYRRLAKRLKPDFTISEADADERAVIFKGYEPAVADCITVYVARRQQAIVGSVHLVRHPPQEEFPLAGQWFYSLEVWPLWRRMGLGEALLRKVLDQAKAENAPALFCLVFADAPAALKLYHKLGFKRVVVPGFEEQLEDEQRLSGRRRVVLCKSLD